MGQTSEYKEFEEKTKNWTKDDEATVANEFMQLFVEFGQMKKWIQKMNRCSCR